MHLLGYSYDTRKKSFYVDGHERADVVSYRYDFCKRYLTEYEPRCKRWVQMSTIEAANFGFDLGFGYLFGDDLDFIEFHEDYIYSTINTNIDAKQYTFKSVMSVRVPETATAL